MTQFPADILQIATTTVSKISSRMESSSTLGDAAAEIIAEALMEAVLAERQRTGGASATRFRDKLVIVHPDMPAHVWDGETMRPADFTPAAGTEYYIREGYMFFAGGKP